MGTFRRTFIENQGKDKANQKAGKPNNAQDALPSGFIHETNLHGRIQRALAGTFMLIEAYGYG